MNAKIFAAVLLVFALALSLFAKGTHHSGWNKTAPALQTASIANEIPKSLQQAEAVWVIDGDTVIVQKRGQRKMKIRLSFIDCPETGQEWGRQAKYALIKLVGRKTVRLEEHGQDKYGRTLATVYVQQGPEHEWINVNERMVALGQAWVARWFIHALPKARQSALTGLEAQAKTARIGLWGRPDPVPPWVWREKHAKDHSRRDDRVLEIK